MALPCLKSYRFMGKNTRSVLGMVCLLAWLMPVVSWAQGSFTNCGSKWYQRLGLQLLEVEQATRGGYSFDLACQAHDACYVDCITTRPECDKKLLADAEGVCVSAQNKVNCVTDAQAFFQKVSEKGEVPFRQAREKCPVSTKAGTATNPAETGSDTNAAHVVDNATSGLSGDEVAKTLGPTKENARAAAIAKMVKQGAIHSPLTADELAAILNGTTGGYRRYAIAQLSALINPHLSAPEAATVLGSVNELRENERASAIRSLVRTTVPGSWGAEASEPLNGCTGVYRRHAIAQLASRLRANLTGMEVATILGQTEELRENERASAIRSLVDAGRLRLPFSGDELSLVLTGTTGVYRSYAIGLLTKRR